MSLFETFYVILIVGFSLVAFFGGILIAKFGSGKSRVMGIVVTIIGVLAAGLWYYQSYMGDMPWRSVEMWNTIAAVLGGIIGAIVGLGLFLIAIMKS